MDVFNTFVMFRHVFSLWLSSIVNAMNLSWTLPPMKDFQCRAPLIIKEVCSSRCCSRQTNQTKRPCQAKSGALKECNLICAGVERMFCQSATLLLGHVGPAVCVCLFLRLAERTRRTIQCLFGCRRCRAELKVIHKPHGQFPGTQKYNTWTQRARTHVETQPQKQIV